MTNILYVVQIILGVTLVGLVVVQAKNLGAGAVFGGDSSFQTTRRGFERTLFNLTAVVAGLFFIVAIVTAAIAS